MERYVTTNEQETESLAESFATRLKKGDIIAFRGGLGAGKTAFTRGLARGLGVSGHVSSPTFSLIHEYPGGEIPLYHFDMYRVEGLDSLESTGFFDYLDMGGILAIEWSENIKEFLPEHSIVVEMSCQNENTREITIEGGPF